MLVNGVQHVGEVVPHHGAPSVVLEVHEASSTAASEGWGIGEVFMVGASEFLIATLIMGTDLQNLCTWTHLSIR